MDLKDKLSPEALKALESVPANDIESWLREAFPHLLKNSDAFKALLEYKSMLVDRPANGDIDVTIKELRNRE